MTRPSGQFSSDHQLVLSKLEKTALFMCNIFRPISRKHRLWLSYFPDVSNIVKVSLPGVNDETLNPVEISSWDYFKFDISHSLKASSLLADLIQIHKS